MVTIAAAVPTAVALTFMVLALAPSAPATPIKNFPAPASARSGPEIAPPGARVATASAGGGDGVRAAGAGGGRAGDERRA